jgi:hypothetical protein
MKSHLLRELYGHACFLLTVDWRDCLARAIEFRLVIEPATLHLGVLGLSELRYLKLFIGHILIANEKHSIHDADCLFNSYAASKQSDLILLIQALRKN